MVMSFDWINEPKKYQINKEEIIITTEPDTDLWEKTHYGFSRKNAPMYVTNWVSEFSEFEATTFFDTSVLYDQCGVVIYIDEDHWAKFSSEYETSDFQRLGGVVTKNGYSDWSTQNISTRHQYITYRVKREGNDFEIYAKLAGQEEQQIRIFNLKENTHIENIKIGLYACSPQQSSFEAVFSDIKLDGKTIF